MSRPVPALTQENHREEYKLQLKTQNKGYTINKKMPTKSCQHHPVENVHYFGTARQPLYSPCKTVTKTKPQQHRCSVNGSYCKKKKSEDCKFRPGWRFDRGVMGLQLSLLFFPDPLKMGLSKTASGTATQQKEVWWLNNIWKELWFIKWDALSPCALNMSGSKSECWCFAEYSTP